MESEGQRDELGANVGGDHDEVVVREADEAIILHVSTAASRTLSYCNMHLLAAIDPL